MPISIPGQGSIIEYPYLWFNQSRSGETEGRKDRPVCLAVAVRHGPKNEHHLLLLAITSKPPSPNQEAIEIPETERRRAGLSKYPDAWVVTSEYNYDIAERSFYYDPAGLILGSFSPRFMAKVANALKAGMARGRGRVIRSP